MGRGEHKLTSRQASDSLARDLRTQLLAKGGRVDTALFDGLFNECFDAPPGESTPSIRLNGGSDPAGHVPESNVIETGHVDVHSHHVCDRGASRCIFQRLPVSL